jgi:sucrose-6-phosphate hydrolase SacC (GH32 family)
VNSSLDREFKSPTDDFRHWEFTSTPLAVGQLECPDTWPVVPADGAAAEGLVAIKLSHAGREIVYVGEWDVPTQTLVRVVPPALPALNPPSDGRSQLLDAATYASKCFYDPVHRQQVWTSWVHERYTTSDGGCINATVCSTHTLPRTLLYDADLRAHVTPPVPQTDLLRVQKLFSLPAPLALAAGAPHDLPATAAGMQLEIRATFALPLAEGLEVGVHTRRSSDGLQQTTSSVRVGAPAHPDASTSLTVATLRNDVSNAAGVLPHPQAWSQSIHFPIKPTDRNLTLVVYVDHSIVEAYAQHGRGVATTRTYPTDDALGVSVFCTRAAEGHARAAAGATLLALDVWRMDEIWVDTV